MYHQLKKDHVAISVTQMVVKVHFIMLPNYLNTQRNSIKSLLVRQLGLIIHNIVITDTVQLQKEKNFLPGQLFRNGRNPMKQKRSPAMCNQMDCKFRILRVSRTNNYFKYSCPTHVQTQKLYTMCAAAMENGKRTDYQERHAKSDSHEAQGSYKAFACLE